MASLFGSMSNNSQNKKARSFFFWGLVQIQTQVVVHVLSSIQPVGSLSTSYETHRHTSTVRANINQVEVDLIDQLGCRWLSQPHYFARWSQTGLYMCVHEHEVYAQRCASALFPHLYVMLAMMDRMERAALSDNSTVIVIHLHLATQFIYFFITNNFTYCDCGTSAQRYTACNSMFMCVIIQHCELLSLFLILFICCMTHPREKVPESLSFCLTSICGLVLTTHFPIQTETGNT